MMLPDKKTTDWQFPWEVGDSLGLKLDQVSDEEVRDASMMYEMLNKVGEVIAEYGFKIRQVGAWQAFRSSADDEAEYIKKLGW